MKNYLISFIDCKSGDLLLTRRSKGRYAKQGVQTVDRDNSGQPFVDYDSNTKEGQANYPYYQDKDENASSRNKEGYDITYYDKPNETQKWEF